MLLPPPVPEEGRCPTVPKKSPQKRGMQRVLARPMYTATVYDMRLRSGTDPLAPTTKRSHQPGCPSVHAGEEGGKGSPGGRIGRMAIFPVLSYHFCILVHVHSRQSPHPHPVMESNPFLSSLHTCILVCVLDSPLARVGWRGW